MGYVAQILKAGLSSKEKAIKHSRGRNINFIVSKLCIQVGSIKICFFVKINYVGQVRAAGLSSKEKSSRHSRGHNFNTIVTKFGTIINLVKLQINF